MFAGKVPKARFCGELRTEEALVHTIAGERVEQATGITDEAGPSMAQASFRLPHRQTVTADVLERVKWKLVSLAEAAQVSPEPLAFLHPTPDSNVDVVRLRKHPAIATGDRSQLDQDRILETGSTGGASREIAL